MNKWILKTHSRPWSLWPELTWQVFSFNPHPGKSWLISKAKGEKKPWSRCIPHLSQRPDSHIKTYLGDFSAHFWSKKSQVLFQVTGAREPCFPTNWSLPPTWEMRHYDTENSRIGSNTWGRKLCLLDKDDHISNFVVKLPLKSCIFLPSNVALKNDAMKTQCGSVINLTRNSVCIKGISSPRECVFTFHLSCYNTLWIHSAAFTVIF